MFYIPTYKPKKPKTSTIEEKQTELCVREEKVEVKRRGRGEAEEGEAVKGHVFILFHNLEMVGMKDRVLLGLSWFIHCFLYRYTYY